LTHTGVVQQVLTTQKKPAPNRCAHSALVWQGMAQAGASLLAVNPQRTTPSAEVRQVQGKSAPGSVRQIVWQPPQTKPWSCRHAATTVVGQVQVQV
jgi:hypothetical protein